MVDKTEWWINMYTDILIHHCLDECKIYVWTKEVCTNSDFIRLKQEYNAELQEEVIIALNEERLSMGLGKTDNEVGLMLTILPVNGNGPSTSHKALKRILIFNIYLDKINTIFEDIESKNSVEAASVEAA